MARNFNGSEGIAFSAGAATATFGTWAAIIKTTGPSSAQFIANLSDKTWFQLDAFGFVGVAAGGGVVSSGTPRVQSGDGWCFVAGTKATGTTFPRLHKYAYATNTWTHGDASANQQADASGSVSSVAVGARTGVSPTSGFSGDIAIAAWFAGNNLSDSQVEQLPFSLRAWLGYSPSGLWLLDQSSTSQTVIDLTGGGANQSNITGTSVSTASVPVFGYGHRALLRTRQAPLDPQYAGSGALLSGSGSSAALAVPSGVAANDIIVVTLFVDGGSTTVTPPSGFVEAENSPVIGAGNHSLHVMWKRATGADTGTYTATLSASAYREGAAHRYTGVVTSGNPFDSGTGTAASATNGTVTPAVSTTTLGTNRKVLFVATDWSGGSWTPPSGFTERMDGGVGLITLDDIAQPSAGSTGSISATSTGNDKRAAWIGALIPAAGGSGSQNGATTLTAASSLTAGATAQVAGAAAMTATSGLTASAAQGMSGAVAMTAASSLTTGATVVKLGAVAMSAASTLTSTATQVQPGAASLSATTGLAAAAQQGFTGSAALTATSALSVTAVPIRPGAATLAATSALTAAATATYGAAGAMTATSGLTADAISGAVTGASLSAVSSLTAAAVPVRPGTAALTAASALTASAAQTTFGAAGLSAASGLTVIGFATGFGAASLTAVSALTAAGSVVPAGGVTLTSATLLTAAAQQGVAAAVAMSSQSGLTVAGFVGKFGAVPFTAASALTATAGGGSGASADLSAASALVSGGTYVAVPAAVMSAAGTLTTAGVSTRLAALDMVALSALTASAGIVPPSGVTMTAIGNLVVAGVVGQRATVAMVAASLFAAASTGGHPVTRRPGILTPGSTRPNLTPGSRRYPMLTPGSQRGPSYSGE